VDEAAADSTGLHEDAALEALNLRLSTHVSRPRLWARPHPRQL